MDSFDSQSWGATTYEFEPFAQISGEIKFDITMNTEKGNWSVSLPSAPEVKAQTFSPVFAFARVRMMQNITPHRRFKPPNLKRIAEKQTNMH